jgi:two-component system, NarL family, response regulator LiaR
MVYVNDSESYNILDRLTNNLRIINQTGALGFRCLSSSLSVGFGLGHIEANRLKEFMGARQTVDRSIRVAVVDGNEDSRFYFRDVFQTTEDFRFAKGFSNANEALAGIPQLRPELVIMDLYLPDLNGAECIKRLKRIMPDLIVIVITGTQNAKLVERSWQAGAVAYLTKPVSSDQCLATLRFIAVDRTKTSPGSQESRQESFFMARSEICSTLSPRESEVMKSLANGLLYKEISGSLGISYSAVHKHQHNIFQKLQVSNRSEAMRLWLLYNGQSV